MSTAENNGGHKKKLLYPLSKPVHSASVSLLSTSSGFNNYRGFLNLCIILLALSNGRVALENIIKYGILIDPLQWLRLFTREPFRWPAVTLVLISNVFILSTFLLECKLAKNAISEAFAYPLKVLNLTTVLIFPVCVVLFTELHPIGASLVLGTYCILFLKLVSYAMVNRWCRKNRTDMKNGRKLSSSDKGTSTAINKQEGTALVKYPDNLNVKDLYYFLCAPTLCYELNFPRTDRIQKKFLINRAIEILFLTQLSMALIQQWMVPIIKNSTLPFKEMNYYKMLERLLKLAVPNHVIWLVFFYWYFHSLLNFIAELLHFADRAFYYDWWNAETVQYFWQNWNVPVHRWCVRHLYLPLINRGYGKGTATFVVFMVSAFFHEYLVSVPLKMFRTWAFMGMAAQMPFSWFVARYLTGKYSNMAVWLSLIIGQPLAILMYYHDYYIIHYET